MTAEVCTDPECDFKLPDSERPCRELGGHGAVSGGACPAFHCRLHLGRDRLGLGKFYGRAEDVCLLHLMESLEATPSTAEIAAALGLAKATAWRAEVSGLAKAGAAGLNEDQIVSVQRLRRNRAA